MTRNDRWFVFLIGCFVAALATNNGAWIVFLVLAVLVEK